MIDLFEGTGSIHEDIERFKEYLQDEFRAYRTIKTKNHEQMYLMHGNDDKQNHANYIGRIYVLSVNGIIGLLEYEATHNPNILTIREIQFKEPAYYGIGIGTGMMKFLQEYAMAHKMILIKGYLEPYDIEHNRERLMNFYSKHDFNVDFYHREVKKIIGYHNVIKKP